MVTLYLNIQIYKMWDIRFLVEYFKELHFLLSEMSFYLLPGFFFAGVLHVYIRQSRIVGFMGKNNIRSVANASLLGIPLPLCSCGVITTGLSLFKNGASKGAAVSFLISTPQTGVDSIMVTCSLLGLPFAILRPVVALLTGVAGGLFTNSNEHNSGKRIGYLSSMTDKLPVKRSFKEVIKYGFVEFLEDIAKWLVIGLFAAALLAVLIPDNFFAEHGGAGFIGMLIILAGSVPLYVCATGSVPIAAVLMLKGLSPGAVLVFLMAGPATNIAAITVLGQILGKRTTFIYLVTIILGALLSGWFIDAFLPAEWFLIPGHAGGHASHLLPEWLKSASSILLGILLINGLYLRYKSQKKGKIVLTDPELSVKKIQVQGLTCPHCKANVENGLKKLEGIETAVADLKSGVVEISGSEIDLEKVKTSIEGGGYIFRGKI